MGLTDLTLDVYERILESDRQWRIDGIKQRPSYEDVEILLERMIEQVRKSPTPISIESGGILVKNTDGIIDIYCYAGEAK